MDRALWRYLQYARSRWMDSRHTAEVAVFVVLWGQGVRSAAGLGALFELVVYGVYDLTNYSTLARWPLALTLVDIIRGTAACAAATAAIRAATT